MNPNDEYDDYDDMEQALGRQIVPEKTIKIWRNMAAEYLAQKQLENKGELLGHYKSSGFLKTYVDVYEKAIIGKVEPYNSKRAEHVNWGYAVLAQAIAENGVLYFLMSDERVYKIRFLKKYEKLAYIINGQIIKAMRGSTDESEK